MNTPLVSTGTLPPLANGNHKPYAVVSTGNEQVEEGMTIIAGSYMVMESLSQPEQEEFDYRLSLYHRVQPMQAADTAINAIDKRLDRLDQSIAVVRPTIAKGSWDLTIKDGKLEAVGMISQSDKDWLNERLNADGLLKAAMNSYVKAAGDYLETTDENPAYAGVSAANGARVTYNFTDVQKQMEGNVLFRHLSAQSWNSHQDGHGGRSDPGPYRGATTLELVAQSLTPSELFDWFKP